VKHVEGIHKAADPSSEQAGSGSGIVPEKDLRTPARAGRSKSAHALKSASYFSLFAHFQHPGTRFD